MPITQRPSDVPDDWVNAVPGEPLPDSMKDKRDASLRAPAPEGLEVTRYDDNSISLEWEASNVDSVVIAYLVEIKEGTGSWVTQQTVFNRTTATASGLKCNTSYSFRVSAAAFQMAYGSPSDTETQSTTLCTVAAPGSFTKTSNTCNSATFSWTAPTGAGVYRIDRKVGDDWIVTGYALAPATTDTVAIPENGMWAFRVSARGNGTDYSRAYGAASNEATATTPVCIRKVSYSFATYSATEGGSAVSVRVTFSPRLRQARSIPITASGSDSYTLGGLTNNNLSAAVGAQTASFTIAANQDSDCDDETVTLGFTLPSGMIPGSIPSTVVTLSDDDPASVCVVNDPPYFEDPNSRTREVPENLRSGTRVGAPVTAMDDNGDAISYAMTGSSHFRIDGNTGQIFTTRSLDRESTSQYRVSVTPTDEHDLEGDPVGRNHQHYRRP